MVFNIGAHSELFKSGYTVNMGILFTRTVNRTKTDFDFLTGSLLKCEAHYESAYLRFTRHGWRLQICNRV